MNTFHHGTLESPRLAKLLAYLKQRGDDGATTLELAQGCYSTRPSSDVSELRANGVLIETLFEGVNENGRRVHRYRLIEREENEPHPSGLSGEHSVVLDAIHQECLHGI